MTSSKNDDSDRSHGVLDTILSIVNFTRDLVGELTGRIDGTVEDLQRRFIRSLFAVLTLLSGGLLLVLGIFYTLIDHAHVPRAATFSVGGLLILLVAIILIQANKNR